MLMKPEPIFEAVDTLRTPQSRIVLLSPQGQQLQQQHAEELAEAPHLIFICGHYEGVDERVRIGLADMELSIGDYILSNGNLAAMVVVDAIVRLLPGALGCEESAVKESFSDGLLEYPQYTRPDEYRGMRVPEILLSGDHAAIETWRLKMATERTRTRRPDLLV
jgi:tRNA (guanine37-N1)-methyltransferase